MNKLVNVRSYLTNLSTAFRRPETVAHIGNLCNAVNTGVNIPEDAILELKRHIDEVDVSLENHRDLGDSLIIVTTWINHFDGQQLEKPKGTARLIKSHVTKEVIPGYTNQRTLNYIGRLLRTIRDDAWTDDKGISWLEDHLIEMNHVFSEHPPEMLIMDHITTAMWINGFVPKAAAA